MKSAKLPVLRSRKLERCKGRGTKTVPRQGGAKESVSEASDVNQTRQSQDCFAGKTKDTFRELRCEFRMCFIVSLPL